MFVSVSALCLTEETQREKIFSKYALRDTAELKSPNMINPPLQDFPELLQLMLHFVASSYGKLQRKLKDFYDAKKVK